MAAADRVFLAFMAAAGVAAGAASVLAPGLTARVPAFFLILIAMACFEGGRMLVKRGEGDALMSMEMRFIGLAIAVVLAALIAWLVPAEGG